jgi:protein phosphatase 1 regulatory subunit 12A
VEEQDRGHERRPSWRLRIESGDKSRFTLEDTVREGVVSSTPPSSSRLSHNPSNSNTSSHHSPTEQRRTSRLEAARSHALHHQGESETPGSPTTGLTAVQRKKKPKRRSTGVLSAEDIGPRSDESADENGASPTHDTHETSPLKSNLKTNGGGQVDYKKLWEESQEENSRLRSEMEATRQDLDSTRQQLDSAIQVLAKNSVSDIEKREKKVLEKKLGEMEDELKTLDQLKADNQRLRDENGALIRVISKLSK